MMREAISLGLDIQIKQFGPLVQKLCSFLESNKKFTWFYFFELKISVKCWIQFRPVNFTYHNILIWYVQINRIKQVILQWRNSGKGIKNNLQKTVDPVVNCSNL